MKKTIFFFFILLVIKNASSEIYEASTLHNSVSRSNTVQELFLNQWDILKEENFYFDIYGKINWVSGFNINTYNAGKSQYETTDLNLVRTYGSMTLAFPFGSKIEYSEKSSFLIAVTATGFHYGLTKTLKADRGLSGTETITDYKHPQFFDDIYALSLLWRPYLTVHTGLIINNEYLPKEDGTISYFDPQVHYKKYFIAMEFIGTARYSMNFDNGIAESVKLDLTLNPFLYLLGVNQSIYFPAIVTGFDYSAAYNDELFDPVWVKTTAGKDANTDYSKDRAKLLLFSLSITQRLTKYFTVEGSGSFQYITKKIYKKIDGDKINPPLGKEWNLLINLEPLKTYESIAFKAYTGMSWYWDPAISIHRTNPDRGNAIYGWIIGCEFELFMLGAGITAQRNFSKDLRMLSETADKWSVEGNLFFRI
ncbi:MAG: hypothetical protein WDA74_09315 [Spirochaetota bacterium]